MVVCNPSADCISPGNIGSVVVISGPIKPIIKRSRPYHTERQPLPGKAEIELDIKDYNVYGNNKTVYLYYFDSVKKKYEYISTVTTEDEKVKVVLEHCSEYVLLDKMIIELGDVNGDEKINARDAKLVLQYFNGNVELTAEQKAKADVNGDGKINARDAKLILQIFNGK